MVSKQPKGRKGAAKPSQARAASTGGRPRTVAPELSPSDRAIAWQHGWVQIGGHRTAINLSPAAWNALQRMAPRRKRGPFIEALIIAEAKKQLAHDAGVQRAWEEIFGAATGGG